MSQPPPPTGPPSQHQRAAHGTHLPAAQPPYPGAYQAVVVQRGTNSLAVAAFVLGLCGLAILPVVLGHVALRQIRSRGESGAGLAIAGLVLGYLQIVLYLVLTLAVLGGAWALYSG